jgi:peptide/nickel transport system substrate-binding protein
VERVAGQRWVFARNADFPAELGGAPRIESLVIAVVDEPTTKFAGLASGDLDFAGIAATMAALAQRDPTMRVLDYPLLFSNALVLNVHRSPFDDARVRHALDLSLDRQRIVTAAVAGYGRPASGPVAPESPFALARDAVRDPPLADSLLDAAGWRREKGGGSGRSGGGGTGGALGARMRDGKPFTFELLTVASGDNAIEQLIQADLAERGIRMEIRQMELGAFLALARATPKTFDALITGIPGDVSLAYLGAMYDSRQRGGSLDYADYHTPRLDALFARTRSAASPAALAAAWGDVQAELARETPAVWVYHSRGVQGISRRMRNVEMDLRGEMESLARWDVGPIAR